MPGMVGRPSRGREGFNSRAVIGFKQSQALEADRREDFIIPKDIATRSVFFTEKFEVKRNGLVCFSVKFRSHRDPGPSSELAKTLLGKILDLSAVKNNPRLAARTSRRKEEKQQPQQN